jgi:hypothetical protein
MKQLRRRCIIRHYDFVKIVKQYVPHLYHTAEFVPFTLKELEQERLLHILKETGKPESRRYREVYVGDLEYPRNYLQSMSDYLYHEKYVDWFSDYDEAGYMWIQARANTPRSVLGWGIFGYDYE